MSLGTTNPNSKRPEITEALPLKIASPRFVKAIGVLKLSLFKVLRITFLSYMVVNNSPLYVGNWLLFSSKISPVNFTYAND